MHVFLLGLGLQNYRGIGPKPQRLGRFKQFNILIGANNAGKSSVLNFISRFLPLDRQRHPPRNTTRLEPLERHAGGTAGTVVMYLAIPIQKFIQAAGKKIGQYQADAHQSLKTVCEALCRDELIWLKTDADSFASFQLDVDLTADQIKRVMAPQEWYVLWSAISQMNGGSLDEHWIPDSLKRMVDAQDFDLPQTKLIPAIRQIGPKEEKFGDYSGRGLIDRLAQIQSPDHDKRHERLIFDRINSFVQTVTGHDEAQIEIPHHREHILVHMDGKVLPLSSLGSGIHEVILIAAFCTISEKEIVCIEEPELHLHPLLQRKLIEYLRVKTNNQYFIATHSPTFIDTPDAAIFHVAIEDKQTVFRKALLRSQRYEICTDLGHKASDLLQSNMIVWVEGPSDRIYLRHWLATAAPELVEGIHYSIMFYGGRLLSHLTAHDDEVSEFISLKALNQNIAILIDSDRAKDSDEINDTKKRIAKEFGGAHAMAWITAGRAIENYVEYKVLQEAVKKVAGKFYGKAARGGRFDHAQHFYRSKDEQNGVEIGPLEKRVDKVKVAREVAGHDANLDILDLRAKIENLVALIRQANS